MRQWTRGVHPQSAPSRADVQRTPRERQSVRASSLVACRLSPVTDSATGAPRATHAGAFPSFPQIPIFAGEKSDIMDHQDGRYGNLTWAGPK